MVALGFYFVNPFFIFRTAFAQFAQNKARQLWHFAQLPGFV